MKKLPTIDTLIEIVDDKVLDNRDRIYIHNAEGNTSMHTHSFIELVYFKQGYGTHIINGQEYPVQSGDLFLLNAGVNHQYFVNNKNGNIQVKNCIFHVDRIDERIQPQNFICDCFRLLLGKEFEEPNTQFIQIKGDYNKDFFNLFLLIENELKKKNEYYLEIIDYALRSVLFKIFRDHSRQNTKRQLSFANVAILEEAIEYIHTHYNEQITLAALASRYNLSPNYLNFIFKQHTSQTLKKYIQKLRCEKACKLLEQDDMSIEALAEQVGYSDTKQFFYLFKRNVGTTPGKYRSKIKNTNK